MATRLSGSGRLRGKPFARVAPKLAPSERILIRDDRPPTLGAATQVGRSAGLSASNRDDP